MENTVTEKQVDAIMEASSMVINRVDDKTVIVTAILPNGFQITESSSCVDPKNFNIDVGITICKGRIKDKIWELEGYLLQSMLFEQEKLEKGLDIRSLIELRKAVSAFVHFFSRFEPDKLIKPN